MYMEAKETKICPHCGKEILAVAKKCKYCQKWISDPSIPAEKQIEVDTTNLQSVSIDKTDSEDKQTANRSVKRRKLLWISLAVMFIVAIIGTIKNYKDDEAKKESIRIANEKREQEWVAEHSCAGINPKEYYKDEGYVKAVIDKMGTMVYSSREPDRKVEITLHGNSDLVEIVDEGTKMTYSYRPSYDYGITIVDYDGSGIAWLWNYYVDPSLKVFRYKRYTDDSDIEDKYVNVYLKQ